MTSNVRRILFGLNVAAGKRFGRMISRVPLVGTLDHELALLMRTLDICNVLDVGAHVGGFANHLRQGGFRGNILSFEPSREAYTELSKNSAADHQWRHRRIALGARDEQRDFYDYARDGQFNSLKRLGEHAIRYEPELAQGPASVVDVHRLDSVWQTTGFDAAETMLKIDTQGGDLDVIEGAGDLLRDIPVILMEVAVRPLYEGVPVAGQVIEAMDQRGFELTGAFPIHRYGNGTRVIEFDCTFVNATRAAFTDDSGPSR